MKPRAYRITLVCLRAQLDQVCGERDTISAQVAEMRDAIRFSLPYLEGAVHEIACRAEDNHEVCPAVEGHAGVKRLRAAAEEPA